MPGYFKDWDKGIEGTRPAAARVHAFLERQVPPPRRAWTPNLNVPMRDSLLWVYEGQTQYWCYVLAARAGLVSAEQSRDHFARTAAFRAAMAGRGWRSLQDTTSDPLIGGAGRPWYDQQRGTTTTTRWRSSGSTSTRCIRELSGDALA